MKKVIIGFVLFALLGALGIGGYVYFGYSKPDLTNYKDLQERAVAAKKYLQKRDLNSKYCIFIDYAIPSGHPRMFVWSFEKNKVIKKFHVMHGCGGGSTAEKPVFSNKEGSECSALGRFRTTKDHGSTLKRSYRISGLDRDNRNAYSRGLLIHRSRWIDIHLWKKYIPLQRESCQGCLTVSSKGMNFLEKIITEEEKPILIWSYYFPKEKQKGK